MCGGGRHQEGKGGHQMASNYQCLKYLLGSVIVLPYSYWPLWGRPYLVCLRARCPLPVRDVLGSQASVSCCIILHTLLSGFQASASIHLMSGIRLYKLQSTVVRCTRHQWGPRGCNINLLRDQGTACSAPDNIRELSVGLLISQTCQGTACKAPDKSNTSGNCL